MTVSSCHARPGPRLRPRADRDARQRDPARRHPRRLRLRPPRRRRLGHSRSAPPAPSWSRTCTPTTAAPRAPTTAPSSPTATSTARPPRALLELGPLARDATPDQAARHDRKTAELARYKLGRITADDADGYHRVACPAAMGKIRCPLRPASMTLDRDRPEILTPPEHPPACCTQQTITVPPDVAAKTRQKHDYPSAATAAPTPGAPAPTRLLHRQGPRQQQHRPRLVPPHGPGTPHAVAHLPAHRPQPAHPHRLGRPPGRQRPPRRRRAAPETRRRRRKTLASLAAAPP